MADIGGGVDPAGTVADAHLRAARREQAAEGGDERGVRGDGAVRPAAGDEVDLEGDLHAGAHPIEAAKGREGPGERRFHIRIVCAADDGHVCHAFFPHHIQFSGLGSRRMSWATTARGEAPRSTI